MPVNLSIKHVPDDLAQRLRERAVRNHRSLQGELMAIIEAAVMPARLHTIDAVRREIAKLAQPEADTAADLIRLDPEPEQGEQSP